LWGIYNLSRLPNQTLHTSIDFLYSYRNYNQEILQLAKKAHNYTGTCFILCLERAYVGMQMNFQRKSEQ